jgi:hypothetical protein
LFLSVLTAIGLCHAGVRSWPRDGERFFVSSVAKAFSFDNKTKRLFCLTLRASSLANARPFCCPSFAQMARVSTLIFAVLLAAAAVSASASSYRLLGTFNCTNPAFVEIFPFATENDLFITE